MDYCFGQISGLSSKCSSRVIRRFTPFYENIEAGECNLEATIPEMHGLVAFCIFSVARKDTGAGVHRPPSFCD
eukprot:scaffold1328_cov162-Amphora_coffeaeformis.AAC.18